MSINLGMKEVVLEQDTMIVTETDEKGTIIFASRDFCDVSGFSFDELVGQKHNIVRHPFMPSAAFNDLWSSVKSGKTWNGIVINRTKEGNYYWVNATVYKSKTRNNITKYISVRVKPSSEEIQRAVSHYNSLRG